MMDTMDMVERDRANQFRLIRSRLTWLWAIVALIAATASRFDWFPAVAAQTQLLILAVTVAMLGVPHGALDHLVARDLYKARFPRRWLPFFLALYIGLAAIVMLGWWLAAPAMLVLFLLASALHFGLGDASYVTYPVALAWLEVLLMGAMPIFIPWIIFPQEVAMLFGWLANNPAERWLQPLSLRFNTVLAILTIAAFFAVRFFREAASRGSSTSEARSEHTRFLLEFFATASLFATIPPLLAFTWYFCGLHAPRHLLSLAERLHGARTRAPWPALTWVLVQSLPLTLITLIGAVFGYVWLQSFDHQSALLRVVFWGLAALTFPHMLLTAIWDRTATAIDNESGVETQPGNPFGRL